MNGAARLRAVATAAQTQPPQLEVVIEIPRGSFLKRGSTGRVDFISPLPCPFNYGSIPTMLGMEGDLLDAVVLGPRLPLGSRVTVRVWGAVILADRGMTDDKLICSDAPVTFSERQNVLRFFSLYAKCKGLLNICGAGPGAMHATAGARLPMRSPAHDQETTRGRARR